jgi:hypothetical protein
MPPGAISLQSLQDAGTDTGAQLVQTFFWAFISVNTNRILEIGDWSGDGAAEGAATLVGGAAQAVAEGKRETLSGAGFRPVREVPLPDGDTAMIVELIDNTESHRTAFRIRRNGNSWRMVMGKGGPQEVKLTDDMLRD